MLSLIAGGRGVGWFFFFFFVFFLFSLLLSFRYATLRFLLPRAQVTLRGKRVSDSLGSHRAPSLCLAVAAAGGQLIVQPPFSLKGFLSSGTPFSSGSSPAMDSMYSLISLPVLETCQGRRHSGGCWDRILAACKPVGAAGKGNRGQEHPTHCQVSPRASAGRCGHLAGCGAAASGLRDMALSPWGTLASGRVERMRVLLPGLVSGVFSFRGFSFPLQHNRVRKSPWGTSPWRFGWKTHHLPLVLHLLLQLVQLHLQNLLLCHVLRHVAL